MRLKSRMQNDAEWKSLTTSRPFHYNGSGAQQQLPHDLQFHEGHIVTIVTYSILIVISTIGNITVLAAMWRRRRKSRTRINTMLMHLAIADLLTLRLGLVETLYEVYVLARGSSLIQLLRGLYFILGKAVELSKKYVHSIGYLFEIISKWLVTFLMMPLEIFWAATVEWIAGDVMCRITAFFRIFGLYLSSFIIICISVDRYLAVLKPMNLYQVDQRGKVMLTSAWLFSIIFSTPQSIIFHVESHPDYPQFKQCVMLNSFPSKYQEMAYLYLGMVIMYLLPLAVIVFCYTSIVIEIFKRSTENNLDSFRRSGLGFLGRARSRTLKMTIIIVVVFIICWTPYYIMAVWFWIDWTSAKQIDPKVQRFLFLFASTNSCMNPIVYGIFNIRTRRAGGPLERGRTYSGRISYATDIRLPALTLSLRSVE